METYKIYIFGIVALALALAVLSFHLLADRKKKKVVQLKMWTMIYIYVFFFMIVFMLLIMIEFHKGPEIILSNNDDYQLVIKEQVGVRYVDDVASNSATLYQDPAKHFFLTLPSLPDWREAKVRNGLRAYLETAGLETGKTNVESFIKWNPYKGALSCILNDITVKPYDEMIVCLSQTILESTFGQILQSSSSTVFEYGDPITVQISPEFRTPLSSLLIPKSLAISDTIADSSNVAGAEVPEYIDLSFINYVSVSVLDKSKFDLDDEQISMTNYFLKNTINLSSNAEKMIASEKLMFFTSSFDFENARYGNESKDFRVHRWVRMIEEPQKLFIIEMAYCPGTDENGMIWKDQKLMFESFGLLTE